MPRFTLKDLFVATTLIAVGLAGLCWTVNVNKFRMLDRRTGVDGWQYHHFAAFVAAAAVMTAGALVPFRRIKIGLLIGFAIALLIVLFSDLGRPEWSYFNDPPGDYNTEGLSSPLS